MDRDYLTVAEYATVHGITRQSAYKCKVVVEDALTHKKMVPLSALSDTERDIWNKMQGAETVAKETPKTAPKQDATSEGDKNRIQTLEETVAMLQGQLSEMREEKERLYRAVDALTKAIEVQSASIEMLKPAPRTRLIPSASAEPERKTLGLFARLFRHN